MSKSQLRDELLARRRQMTPPERLAAADAIASHALATPVIARASRIACYLSMPSEPGTAPLIEALAARGVEVVVPISLADQSLDWVAFDPAADLRATSLGIPEPDGERLGPGALATCDVVIVPALAVDQDGHRLGRGAGYYDRALVAATAPVCAIVFAHELLPSVPHEPHDVAAQMTLTPHGLFRTLAAD